MVIIALAWTLAGEDGEKPSPGAEAHLVELGVSDPTQALSDALEPPGEEA
jgi:hypothetical protein